MTARQDGAELCRRSNNSLSIAAPRFISLPLHSIIVPLLEVHFSVEVTAIRVRSNSFLTSFIFQLREAGLESVLVSERACVLFGNIHPHTCVYNEHP